jgi:pyruvate/2-oxoglutarate dehydrogenase complex dihydrolipoamide dehydrogenase (E3) component
MIASPDNSSEIAVVGKARANSAADRRADEIPHQPFGNNPAPAKRGKRLRHHMRCVREPNMLMAFTTIKVREFGPFGVRDGGLPSSGQELTMSQPERVDLLILGSGEGGKFLAWHMAKSGHRTALVERKLIGGSCPNTNCLPSKNEIWSAKVADLLRHGDRFGAVTGAVAIDMKKVQARKRAMVDGLIAMHLDYYKASGTELIMGRGQFIAPKTLEVSLNDGGSRVLTGDRVVLNLGTHALIPDIPGLAAAKPLSNVELLELDRLPAHLIVLGGGYVGLEMAQAYRRFGSRVSIIEAGPQLAGREDPDVAAAISEMLREEGIELHLGAQTLGVQGRSGEAVSLRLRTTAGDQTVDGSDLLVAVGRVPNTAGIGLDLAGVALDARGYIVVNERLETSAPGVSAIGECAGSPQFTLVSFDDFRVVRDSLTGGDRTTRDRLVPYCMFTDPPLARVGLSEGEARRHGAAVRVARLPIVNVMRSHTLSETRGFMKALVEAEGDRILGFAMFGPEAGDVVAVVQTAMLAGMPYTGLRDAIIAHPTMAEGLGALFSNVPDR